MIELARKDHMSVYGEENNPEYIYVSMGVAYKLESDAIWFVRIPVDEDNNPQVGKDTMVAVYDEIESESTEVHRDEFVPPEPVNDGLDWFETLDF
jgi:hypothetical protein